MRGCVGGVEVDRAIEFRDRQLKRSRRALVPLVPPLEVRLVHFGIDRANRGQPLPYRRCQRELDGAVNPTHDIVFQRSTSRWSRSSSLTRSLRRRLAG
jgi:hypothetical protein